jgi:hypothetical protein
VPVSGTSQKPVVQFGRAKIPSATSRPTLRRSMSQAPVSSRLRTASMRALPARGTSAPGAVTQAGPYEATGGAELHNDNGSFFDFSAELFNGRERRTIATPLDDWGGRAATVWVREPAAGERFAGSSDGLLETAQTLDRLYGGARRG